MTWQITCFTLKTLSDFYGDDTVLQYILFKKTTKRQGLPVWFSNICDTYSVKIQIILTDLYFYCILLYVLMFVWINLNIPRNLNSSTQTELT